MNCASCGNENPEDSLFCEGCGAKLEKSGPACDASVSSSAKFCRRCGHTLDSEGPSPADYTPKHLADKILTSKSAIEGERKQTTVLFADVKSSMELSERLDPARLAQLESAAQPVFFDRSSSGNPLDSTAYASGEFGAVEGAMSVSSDAHDAEPPTRSSARRTPTRRP